MKIASLEDDLDQARRIQQVLTAAGYTCSSYQQSRDLLSAMRNESFDLVLLDWHLPDIDGDDVVRWLRANIGPRIPVIFLTNRSSEDDLVEGLRAGADDYIVKPLRPLELLARVAALLRRSQIAEPADESFDVANYRVEPSARTIALNGKAVTLAPKNSSSRCCSFAIWAGSCRATCWPNACGTGNSGHLAHAGHAPVQHPAKLQLRPEHGVRLTSSYALGYRLELTSAQDDGQPAP